MNPRPSFHLPLLHTLVERAGLPAVPSAVSPVKAEALAKAGERRFLFRWRFMGRRRIVRSGITIFLKKTLENFANVTMLKADKRRAGDQRRELLFGIFGHGFNPAMLVIKNKDLEP